MQKEREIIDFAVGLPKEMKYAENKHMRTGICKQSIEEAYLTKEGFSGDGVADLRHHGGPDRAVCVYPHEHYQFWKMEFGQSLPKSNFGENITVSNMLEKDTYFGDVYRLGEAFIQITQSRIPCSTITKRTKNPLLLKRMIETGYTGYLCRVLEEGIVRSDSKITLEERHPHQVSVLFGNEVYFRGHHDVEGMKKILSVEALADEWKELLKERLHKWKI
ncbi:MOSC domain-containing protein [Pseudogracilibacillus sp. ICA-222130]|uniref:MOSC domain-containing protein n=1 Tax=Pseudogracilibacillus sp. ICA-222130 TaxID=3134655 RepID=UPI0030BB0DDB